jgi:hypothetical protein
MSRTQAADIVTVRPTNNVYTVLAIASLLVVIGALVVLYMKANTLFGEGGLLK